MKFTIDYIDSMGRLVRAGTYHRDKDKMIVTPCENGFQVFNRQAITQYTVYPDIYGNEQCTCPSHVKGEYCKHRLKVREFLSSLERLANDVYMIA